MEHFDEKGRVLCLLCGKPFQQITPQHLKKSHDTTIEEFRQKYPDAPLTSLQFKSKQKYKYTKVFDESKEVKNINPEVKIEEREEFDLDKTPEVPKDLKSSVSNFIEDVQTFATNAYSITEFPNPNNLIHKEKIKILNLLFLFFQEDLQNSYFIEKISLSGTLEYRFITDICVPSKKIIFDFPNTFWHNKDVSEFNKQQRLLKDGWKIIEIRGTLPSFKQIKESLKKFDLI